MEIAYGFGFKRVSADKSLIAGDSHSDQQKQIELRSEQLGKLLNLNIVIDKWFDLSESASGEFDMQPILKALEYCKISKKVYKYGFIKSIDRETRGGATIYGQLKLLFSRYGIQLVDVYGIISTQEVNTLSHLGIEYKWSKFSPTWITELLEAERAKGEVRDILTRMIGAEINYVRLGYIVRAAPMGYQNEKIETDHGKRMIRVPHPEESRWFIRMYELRIEGKDDNDIVDEINKIGFKTRLINIHDPDDKRKIIGHKGNKPLTIKQLQRYIENPIYAGINDEKWTSDKPVKCRFKGLVTPEMFNKANRGKVVILNDGGEYKVIRNKTPWAVKRYKDNPDYPFRHYILCHICHEDLKGSAPRSKSGKHSPRYHCSSGHKYWSVNLSEFNKTLKNFVGDVHFSESFKTKFRNAVLKEWELKQSRLSQDSVNYGQLVVQKEVELQNLKEKLKLLSSPTALKMIEDDIEKAEQERAGLVINRDTVEDKGIDAQTAVNYCLYYMEHLNELILSGSNTKQNAKLFGLLFEEKPTYQELVNGTPKLAPIFALNGALEVSEKQFVTPRGFEPRFSG